MTKLTQKVLQQINNTVKDKARIVRASTGNGYCLFFESETEAERTYRELRDKFGILRHPNNSTLGFIYNNQGRNYNPRQINFCEVSEGDEMTMEGFKA